MTGNHIRPDYENSQNVGIKKVSMMWYKCHINIKWPLVKQKKYKKKCVLLYSIASLNAKFQLEFFYQSAWNLLD